MADKKNEDTTDVLPQDPIEKTKDDWGVTGASNGSESSGRSGPYPRDDSVKGDSAEASGCGRFGSFLGMVISIAISGVFFVIINFFYTSIPFLTDDFTRWIPFANVSIVVSVVIQVFQFILNNKILKPVLEVINGVVMLVSAVVMLVIFPFDFSVLDWNLPLEQITRIIMILTIVGIVIGIIVGCVTFISRLIKAKE